VISGKVFRLFILLHFNTNILPKGFMNVYDDRDRKIIKIINNGVGHSRNIVNILNEHLDGVFVEIDENVNEGHFYFWHKKVEPLTDQVKKNIDEKSNLLIEQFVATITLLNHLESEKLATFFVPAKKENNEIKFGCTDLGDEKDTYMSFSCPIYDEQINSSLKKYYRKEIMPTPALRKLERNNFVSEGQSNFKKQFWATWAAIIIAAIINGIGVYKANKGTSLLNDIFSKAAEQNAKLQIESNNLIIKILDKTNNLDAVLQKVDAIPAKNQNISVIPKNKSVTSPHNIISENTRSHLNKHQDNSKTK
jgi:hypothetical protein